MVTSKDATYGFLLSIHMKKEIDVGFVVETISGALMNVPGIEHAVIEVLGELDGSEIPQFNKEMN